MNYEMRPLSRHMTDIQPSDIRKWTSVIESVGGINLAQGNCHVEPGPEFVALQAEVARAIETGARETGYNTYAHSSGTASLRGAIAEKCRGFNGFEADPDLGDGTITVTPGATGALSCCLHALADPGDEVILLEPYYNYHLKALQMASLHPKIVPMHGPNWGLDFDEIQAAVTPRTKALIINTPNNPSGKVFTESELVALIAMCRSSGIFLICDEVYEFMTFDDTVHLSPASLPGASECVFTISAVSKTLAITGWRIGYVVSPKAVSPRIRIANEMLHVCAPTPLQHAVAPFLANWSQFLTLKQKYLKKRDLLDAALRSAGINALLPKGAYYALADFSGLGLESDVAINRYLIDRYKIAGVPGSAFFMNRHHTGLIRFCFAVLDRELERLPVILGERHV